jgi:hypothetical protein
MLHQQVYLPGVRQSQVEERRSPVSGRAIAIALAGLLLSTLGFAMQVAAESVGPTVPRSVADLQSAPGRARDLKPISQPSPATQPIPVPTLPGIIQQDSSRMGGDRNATPASSGWLMQINRSTQTTSQQSEYPVIDSYEQPTADHIIISVPLE